MTNEEIIKYYPIQDDIWPSRRWNKDRSDYQDLSGHEVINKMNHLQIAFSYDVRPYDGKLIYGVVIFIRNSDGDIEFVRQLSIVTENGYNEMINEVRSIVLLHLGITLTDVETITFVVVHNLQGLYTPH